MKEQILKLRNEGKSYNEIVNLLGCSKATVAYHCGKGQKEKTRARAKKRRSDLVITRKVDNFQYDRKIKDKAEDFQRERILVKGVSKLGERTINFRWHDVINKFGWETTCYLTGRSINIREPKTYHFDHIIPVSKGGDSSLDNLGIACKEANMAKNNLMVDEFIDLCKEVLEYNGYTVSKNIAGVRLVEEAVLKTVG